MNTSDRLAQRLSNFANTVRLLEKACTTKIEDERDLAGIIQFYEMAIELSWKCLRDYLVSQEYEDPISPKSSVKAALQNYIITEEEAELWLTALNLRNITSHTYDETRVKAIVEEIKESYLHLIKTILQKLS